MTFKSLVGVPSDTPVQTVSIPLPTGGTELALLIAFAIGEILPFLGGPFKEFNGITQGFLRLLSLAKPFRREDEAVAQLKAELEAIKKTLKRQGFR
jgi:hypothetical protein